MNSSIRFLQDSCPVQPKTIPRVLIWSKISRITLDKYLDLYSSPGIYYFYRGDFGFKISFRINSYRTFIFSEFDSITDKVGDNLN